MKPEDKKSQFVIITGLSGAGKNQALRCLEDMGFFCVDNLPTSLIPTFAHLCRHSTTPVERIALGIDIREGVFLDDFREALRQLKNSGYIYQIIFLEASNQVLVRRFSETRRRHPLGEGESILGNIEAERKRLRSLREKADLIIDTTYLNVHELKENLLKNFLKPTDTRMVINIVSFGYKYGLPQDADLIFDMRFLPNPYYHRRLRLLTGRNRLVRNFVLSEKVTKELLAKLYNLLDFLIPYYRQEGKVYLTIALGCTGGRHRSVVLAGELKRSLLKKGEETVRVEDRDINKA